MVYRKISELPKPVQAHLPKHAQEIYKEAFNHAWEQYKSAEKRKAGSSREQTSHRVAWNAVKREYEKGSDDNWHKKV